MDSAIFVRVPSDLSEGLAISILKRWIPHGRVETFKEDDNLYVALYL